MCRDPSIPSLPAFRHGARVSRRRPVRIGPEADAAVRGGFEPLYGRDLLGAEVTEIADNLRRFHEVLRAWSDAPLPQTSPNAPHPEATHAPVPTRPHVDLAEH